MMADERDRPIGGFGSDDPTVIRTGSTASPGSVHTTSGDGNLHSGDILNHTHEIEILIARGGMGEVYRARNVITNDLSAIKMIRPDLVDDEKIVELFRREAAALRKVRNPAVVHYEGLFKNESGRLYLAMEYVEGESLSRVLRSGPLSVSEVIRLRNRLAGGLAAAHEQGVFHRDMSPDNVLVLGHDVEHAKIIDFGIAKLADRSQATIIGEDFAGKYSFSSPEQMGLFGGAVDGRSDIYSLGLVLAAAAIGQPLDMGNSPASVIERRQKVPDLSRVPEALRAELSWILQPDPAARPQSALDLIDVVPAVQTTMRPQPQATATEKPVPKKVSGRTPLILGAGGALLVMLATAAFLLRPNSPSSIDVGVQSTPEAPPGVAAVSSPTVDRAKLSQMISQIIAQPDCSRATATLDDDYKVALGGFVSSRALADKLPQIVAGLPGVRGVSGSSTAIEPPFCDAMAILPSGFDGANVGPSLKLNHADLGYAIDDLFSMIVTPRGLPGASGYLYVESVDADGNVFHAFPLSSKAQVVKEGQKLDIRKDWTGGPIKIGLPTGQNMLIALYSARPLVGTQNAETTTTTAYLPELAKGITDAAAANSPVVSSYLFYTVRDKK